MCQLGEGGIGGGIMEANTRYVCSDCGCDFTVHSGFGKPHCPYCLGSEIKEQKKDVGKDEKKED